MTDDLLRRSGRGIRPGVGVFLSRDPPHDSGAAEAASASGLLPLRCEANQRHANRRTKLSFPRARVATTTENTAAFACQGPRNALGDDGLE